MRKSVLCLSLAGVMCAGMGVARAADAVAAEAIPADFIKQFAPLAVMLIQQQFPQPPVKVEPLADKALGYHVQEKVGIVVMPDKNLTAEAIEKAADKDVPLAVLATKSLTLEVQEAAVATEKLAVAELEGIAKIPVFYLAVKGQGEERMLHVYSKDGTALSSAPLKKMAGDAASPVAVKLTNINLEKKKLDAVFSFGGAYEGTVKLAQVDL